MKNLVCSYVNRERSEKQPEKQKESGQHMTRKSGVTHINGIKCSEVKRISLEKRTLGLVHYQGTDLEG